MLIILNEMIMIPLRLAFEDVDNYEPFQTSDNVITYIFIADLLLNFNTAYYEKG